MFKKNSIDSYIKSGYRSFKFKKYKSALKFFKKALELDKSSYINNFNVASSYHFLKDYKNAICFYLQALKLKPNDIPSLNNLSCAYSEIKDYEMAKKYLKLAIKLSPFHPEAYYHLGKLIREIEGDLKLSSAYFNKAILLDDLYPDTFYQLGYTYYKIGNFKKAKINLEKCLKLDSNHTEAINLIKKLN